MLDILDEAITSGAYEDGTDQRKASDFFSIGMDSLLAEKAGITPVNELFEKRLQDFVLFWEYLRSDEYSTTPSSDFFSIDLNEFEKTKIFNSKTF